MQDPDESPRAAVRREARHRPARGIGPIALVLPLCVLILGILWTRHWRGAGGGERAVPPAVLGGLDVPGWAGTGELAGGQAPEPSLARIRARLTRLHRSPARQAHERRALGEALGREDGEPFLLLLALAAQSGVDGSSLDVAHVRVEDARGVALEPAVPLERLPAGGIVDPVLALFAPPLEPLARGREVGIVLWGRAPVEGARLVGLEPAPDPPLILVAQPVAGAEIARSLARLDRAEGPR